MAAAADLAPLEKDLSRAFGGSVRFSFGSSGMLARQIENGAPFDVFLSANERFAWDLEKQGKLQRGTVAVYASGRLGLWSKSGKYKNLQDLTQPFMRHLAIANPQHAPYGVAARDLLQKRGLWSTVEKRIVYGENVQQTFQFAASGNAEACITAWSLVKGRGGVLLPAEWHSPIRQAGGVVGSSRNAEAAARFLKLLHGPEGRRILERYGLDPAPQ